MPPKERVDRLEQVVQILADDQVTLQRLIGDLARETRRGFGRVEDRFNQIAEAFRKRGRAKRQDGRTDRQAGCRHWRIHSRPQREALSRQRGPKPAPEEPPSLGPDSKSSFGRPDCRMMHLSVPRLSAG